ncbi:MAG: BREX-2 system adenine-specific DNA-methyltransferase PglX, partial [Planctomycetes bacterium]|nr:BREX-2 system adenine-specific DNA-methyltransferase PglX [Planctomycetota bacterium]
ATFEEWRAELITQVAVAWVLSCVFVRFLEDNAIVAPPRISGALQGASHDAGLQRARDERETYFRAHPRETDRDYLLAVFDDLATLPGTKDVFGPHNPVSAYRNWLSGDAAQKLIEFFQKIDTDGTGEIIHDFTDPGWDTRFLGDLYQDLSEAARKKYALLQTPVFVEEFILERTLEPAITKYGLVTGQKTNDKGQMRNDLFKMIDPACGSGHFLLGAFARILKHWRAKEPGGSNRELVNRALASVHGVDLNPYAVAIARFRLLLAAMRECSIARLQDSPAFAFNLACGDSLLHGAPGDQQQVLGFHELAHAYQSEDLPELQRILKPGRYHAVVANPPYITVKDKALNQAYRERYPEVCHRQYSLAVPFMQRLFGLACQGGFVGQITANSFMKREFGKKLVEGYLPNIDLTHVIDTSGAYIPGHGTPTVILFGRQREPVTATVRAVMGIRGEPATPPDPSKGLVWSAIVRQIDLVGSQSGFVSVSDASRGYFERHPWSIGGGGAAELKAMLDQAAEKPLGDVV